MPVLAALPTAGVSLYNLRMVDITPLLPHETNEARLVIYATAHALLNNFATLDEAVTHFRKDWPLRDIDDYQKIYVENCGTFLVTRKDGRIIGTGALRRLEDQVVEVKRLWLLPEFQGQGHGYRMMMRLLDIAREKGYTTVRLETSATYQKNAILFYKRLGFYEIPRFGDDPDDVAFEMPLT